MLQRIVIAVAANDIATGRRPYSRKCSADEALGDPRVLAQFSPGSKTRGHVPWVIH